MINEVVAEPVQPQPFPVGRWIVRAFFLLMLFKFVGCLFMVRGVWGPQVGGVLPNGHTIYFQSQPVGRETDDRLTWIAPNGEVKNFWVDRIHAGFSYVTIKYSDRGDRVWVESDHKVGASLDLATGEFQWEQQPQPKWAELGGGETLAAGRTWAVANFFWPLSGFFSSQEAPDD